MELSVVNYRNYRDSVAEVFDSIGAREILSKETAILIKPNLVNSSPHPVTTSPECCEAVVEYVKACSDAEVIIAEGSGDKSLETVEIFRLLGYSDISERQGVELVDLNNSSLKRLENRNAGIFAEMYLPEIAFTHFIISVPVLKAHSLSGFTGSMKNMIGFAPPDHYSGKFGVWKKALFHEDMHQSIIDLNMYRSPDLTLMDASVGMKDHHLGGRQCDPPVNKIIAGYNPLEVDRKGASFLELDWKQIEYLASNKGLMQKEKPPDC